MFFKSFQGRVSICRSYSVYLLRLIIEIMYSYYMGIIALFVFCVLSENGALRCGQSARLILILAVLRIQAGDLERILLMPGGH